MTTRRRFVASGAVAASSLAFLRSALAQGNSEPEFLFVQSAKSLSFDKASSKMTLEGVSPATIFFSDRPERIAGNMTTAAFIPFWSKGKDNFASNPPNSLTIGMRNGATARENQITWSSIDTSFSPLRAPFCGCFESS